MRSGVKNPLFSCCAACKAEITAERLRSGGNFATQRSISSRTWADDRTRIYLEPSVSPSEDGPRLAQFLDAIQVQIVAIAIHSNRNVAIRAVVHVVGLLPAQVPLDSRAAQHGAG